MWSLVKYRTKQNHGKKRAWQANFGTLEEHDAAIVRAEAEDKEKKQAAHL